MKYLLLILTFLAIQICKSSYAQAPTIKWSKTYGGTKNDIGHSIQQTTDGGYIVAGQNNSKFAIATADKGSGDAWIVKLNSEGAIQWDKVIGGTGLDVFRAVRQTSDGGYIAAGYTNSKNGDISRNKGEYDFLVVKLDAFGDTTWTRCYGGSGEEEAYSVQQTSDGGYIVAGSAQTNSGDVSGNHGGRDYWVVKLDEDGVLKWQKCLGGSGSDLAFSIHQTADKGYFVAGQSSSNNGNVSGNHGGIDFWVVKLDEFGVFKWQKCLGGTGNEYAFASLPTSDGDYIVAGMSTSSDEDVGGNYGSNDYWVVKLKHSDDPGDTGTIVWEKHLGGSGYERLFFVIETDNNDFIVTGDSESEDHDRSGNFGSRDSWLVKLNGSSGNILWERNMGGSSSDATYSIQPTTDGGYILAGYTYSNDHDVAGQNHGESDLWVVKLNPEQPLPVKLVSFTTEMQEATVLLRWKTVSERHNQGFEIEHSTDAREWKTIGFRTSLTDNGNGSQATTYSYTHAYPLPGQNYYRLKQIDLDGKYEYSPIRVITFDRPVAINIYPNPAAEAVTITGLQGSETISITDALGRVLKEHKTGDLHTTISLGGLSDGIYHLHIIPAGREAKTFKIVKTGGVITK